MRIFLAWCAGITLLVGCATTPISVNPGPWSVQLTEGQTTALAELADRSSHTAFAISPSGNWGRSSDQATPEAARQIALRNCQRFSQEGRGNCLVYSVDGVRVAPDVVDITIMQEDYRALSFRSASTYFGRNTVSYSSDGSAAFAQFGQLLENGDLLAGMRRNTALEEALTDSSLVERDGQVVWLGERRAGIRTPARNDPIEEEYLGWRITDAGLLCLVSGRFPNTGREIDIKCIVIRELGNGNFTTQWAQNRIRRSGIVVDGDARYSQAR